MPRVRIGPAPPDREALDVEIARLSSRFSPSESRSRSSAPANTVQVELMRAGRSDFIASGPNSCRPIFISSAI